MGATKRRKLIEELQKARRSRVITYVTSSRPNVTSDIEASDIVHFRKHLDEICTKEKCHELDLFLFSFGGELEAAWELVNLLREYHVDFSVLIPYHARSAATLISLGAKELIMGKMASLGPIDPSVRIEGGNLGGMEVSALDIDSYEDFLRDEYQISKEDKGKALEMLGKDVPPILLGKAWRNYIETKKDAEKMVGRYQKDKKMAQHIVEIFMKKISTHNHSISRHEAKEAGLNVTFAPPKIEKLIWDLYKAYEQDMKMHIPYIDEPPAKKDAREVPFTYIESTNHTSTKIGIEKFTKLDFAKGSYLIDADGPAVYTPESETIPVIPEGRLLAKNGLIYDKTEDIYWVNE